MSTTLPVHGGGAQPVSLDTSGKVTGGPAMSVAVVAAPWKQEGDPYALPVYLVPAGYPVEGGFAVPIVSV